MSAFKRFNRQDVYVTQYSARKSWEASGSALDSYGIETLRGISGSLPYYIHPSDLRNGRHQSITYRSVRHLYYSNFLPDGRQSGSFDNYLQSSLTSGSRIIGNELTVFSLPREIVGTHIEPKSLRIQIRDTGSNSYFDDDYCKNALSGENRYVEGRYTLFGSVLLINGATYLDDEDDFVSASYFTLVLEQHTNELYDDGAGRLYFSGSNSGSYSAPNVYVGDVIYPHGQIILTDTEVARYYSTYLQPVLQWKSNQPIYTHNFYCKVKDYELNQTLNPSALSGSGGKIADNVSGSYFKPYVTTVGMYNDAHELIAVGKLGQPTPMSSDTDTTYVVKLDY